jgi:hypothetical protein
MSERNRKVKQLLHLTYQLEDDNEVPVSDIIEMLIFCLACMAYNQKITPTVILRLYDFWWVQVRALQGDAIDDTPEA